MLAIESLVTSLNSEVLTEFCFVFLFYNDVMYYITCFVFFSYDLLCRNIIVYFSFSFNSLSAFLTFLLDTFLIDEWSSNHYIHVIDSLLLNVCNFFSTYLAFILQGAPVICDFRICDPRHFMIFKKNPKNIIIAIWWILRFPY